MGKTAQGAVWLDEKLLSPYDYWQFWRNTADADVGRFLKLFTDLPLEDIGKLESLPGAEINQAKIVLATEATAMLHGPEAAEAAAETAKTTFTAGLGGEDSSFFVTVGPMKLIDALVGLGFAESRKEAKRLIQQRAIKVNGQLVTDENYVIHAGEYAHITKGKKYHGVAHARASESDIALAVLRMASEQPHHVITYEELYRELPSRIQLTQFDEMPSLTRPNEKMWYQLVRNIRSHQHSPGNLVNLGYLEPIERVGYRATLEGLEFLRSLDDGEQTAIIHS
jgi:hypothetical protein